MLEAGILLAVIAAAAVGFKLRAGKKTSGNRPAGSGGGRGGGSGRRGNDLQ